MPARMYRVGGQNRATGLLLRPALRWEAHPSGARPDALWIYTLSDYFTLVGHTVVVMNQALTRTWGVRVSIHLSENLTVQANRSIVT
jgi:hypothetical protein